MKASYTDKNNIKKEALSANSMTSIRQRIHWLADLPAIGGDVNKDDVIDVMDAVYIQTYWGTNKREADINYDGNVDAFVENNYFMQNPTVDDAPKAKKSCKGQSLDSILRKLNVQ